MNDSLQNWQGAGNIGGTAWVTAETPPADIHKTQQLFVKDTLAANRPPGANGVSRIGGDVYVTPPNKPALPAPLGASGGINGAGGAVGLKGLPQIQTLLNFAKFFDLNSLMELASSDRTELASSIGNALNFSAGTLKGLEAQVKTSKPGAGEVFCAAAQKAVASMSKQELLKISGEKGGQPPEEVRALLFFAVSHPDVAAAQSSSPAQGPGTISPQMAMAATKIRQSVEQSTGEKVDPSFVKFGDQMAGALLDGAFIAAAKKQGVPPKDLKLLAMANSIPSLAAALPPELKQLLAKLQGTVFQDVGSGLGYPVGWHPSAASEEFEVQEGSDFDNKVIQALQQKFENKEISAAQYKSLSTSYFLKGGESASPILKQIVKEQHQSLGLPESYRLPIEPEQYQALLDGSTFAAFKREISAVEPPLSKETKVQLMNALGAEAGVQTLPLPLQTIFKESKVAAIAEISKEYDLPTNWQPKVEGLAIAAANVTNPSLAFAQTLTNHFTERATIATKVVADITMRTGPSASAVTINDYLKTVSEALDELQNQIYKASAADVNVARRTSAVQADNAAAKLRKQQEQINEMHAKMKKMASLKIFLGVFMAFLMVILLPLFLVSIPLLIGAVSNLTNTQNSFMKGMTVIADLIVLIILLPVILTEIMIDGGKYFTMNLLLAMGCPQEVVDKICTALQIICVVAMIIIAVAMMCVPGLQAFAAEMFAGIASAISEVAATIGTAVAQLVATTVEVVCSTLAAMGPVGQIAAQVVKAAIEFAKILLNSLAKFVSETWQLGEKVVSAAEKMIDKAMAELDKILARVSEAISKATASIGDSMPESITKLFDTFFEAVEKVGDLMTKIAEKMDDSPLGRSIKKFGEDLEARAAEMAEERGRTQAAKVASKGKQQGDFDAAIELEDAAMKEGKKAIDEFKEMKQALDDAKDSHLKAQEAKTNLDSELKSLKEELKQAKNDKSNKIDDLKEEVSKKEQEISKSEQDVESKLSEIKTRKQALKAQETSMNKNNMGDQLDIVKAQDRLEGIDDFRAVKDELTSLKIEKRKELREFEKQTKNKMESLQKQKLHKDTEIKELTKKIDDIESVEKDITEKLTEIQKSTKTEKSAKVQEKSKLEADEAAKKTEKLKLEKQQEDLQSARREMKKELDEVHQESSKINQEIDDINSLKTELTKETQKELALKQEELKAAKMKLSRSDQVHEAVVEVHKSRVDFKAAEKELEKLETTYKNLNNKSSIRELSETEKAHLAKTEELMELKKIEVQVLEENLIQAETEIVQINQVNINQAEQYARAASEVTNNLSKMEQDIAKGKSEMAKAAAEAFKIKADALQKVTQALMDSTLNQLQNNADWIKQLGQMRQSMMQGMSDAMTQLSQAIR